MGALKAPAGPAVSTRQPKACTLPSTRQQNAALLQSRYIWQRTSSAIPAHDCRRFPPFVPLPLTLCLTGRSLVQFACPLVRHTDFQHTASDSASRACHCLTGPLLAALGPSSKHPLPGLSVIVRKPTYTIFSSSWDNLHTLSFP